MEHNDIGALWIRRGPKGEFLSGKVNGLSIVVFRNTIKKPDSTEPDWRIFPETPRPATPPKTDDKDF